MSENIENTEAEKPERRDEESKCLAFFDENAALWIDAEELAGESDRA